MKIELPYIGYTIYVKDIAKNKDAIPSALMQVDDGDDYSCTMWITSELGMKDVPTLAHETMHVIQHLSKVRNMDITEEKEHTAYLMQYILNRILGFNYWKK